MSDDYSEQVPKILNFERRRVVGYQIVRILSNHVKKLSKLKVLDYGCSSGVISNILSRHVREVIGIDIDSKAIKIAKSKFKRKNIKFIKVNNLNTKFKDNEFDIVIANQVYNFVENDTKLMKEIYRLLKPRGICYFTARNKFAFMEPQYNVPFLSWFSKEISNKIVIFLKKSDRFVGNYKSYYQLLKLVKKFKLHDYTVEVLRNPAKYGFKKLEKYNYISRIIPLGLLKPLIPNYIWILEK